VGAGHDLGATAELERAESCFVETRGADVKTHDIVGYVVAAFAGVAACGGSPATSIPITVADSDGGTPESGAGMPVKSDAGAGGEQPGVAPTWPDAGDGATNGPPSRTASCCVSGAYYDCPSQTALAQCAGFDVAGCLQSCASSDPACARACGQMASTAHTDPSACTRDASKDPTCAYDAGSSTTGNTGSTSSSGGTGGVTPPPPPPTRENACGGYFLGVACMVGGTCDGDQHCTQNECYPNDVGNPCTFPTDCGSGNHCTAGCCASSAKGSACTTGLDCKSGSCTGGICQ
jgi:hypothetical protein